MESREANESQGSVSRPRRRRRYRALLLLGIGLCLILLLLAVATRDRSLASVRLPDGRRFTVNKLTYGYEHHYWMKGTPLTSGEIWLNKWLERIGRQITDASSRRRFTTSDAAVGLWHSFDWTQLESESTPHWIVVTDDHGWRTAVSTEHLRTTSLWTTPGSEQPDIRWTTFAIPMECRQLRLDFIAANGNQLAKTSVPYEIPASLLQHWNVQPLPATEKEGKFSVTLRSLTAERIPFEAGGRDIADLLMVTPDLSISIDGAESSSWGLMNGGVPLLEILERPSVATAGIESRTRAFARLNGCSISPFDSGWKVYLPIVCKDFQDIPDAEQSRFNGVSFETGLLATPTTLTELKLGNATVKYLGAGQAGTFEYEGAGEATFALPNGPALEVMTGDRLRGTMQVMNDPQWSVSSVIAMPSPGTPGRSPQQPMLINLKFSSERPHIALSLRGSADLYPVVNVTDSSGRRVAGELINAQGLLVWLADAPQETLDNVDVMITLQKPKMFTFVVSPPPVDLH